ncbi:SMF family [Synechococcus sp. PCC 7335]|uniref:DNA-processing protein DprA n=1 Tax=Synechococcus sp. (strain ATCC 29403 / PCC 7335) TaxID=91464 RepID=UPI00017EE120|nr:DNA-processing protein DprA [Synechococcus sp. PCC 7335]EDX82501.1 SMF family [Synechococcus sp. PCC 7335]EDX82590.1 SMF family [Synechococcus sp. PCC 7335]
MFAEYQSSWPNLISPVLEIAAYEYLWTQYPSVPKLAKLFASFNHELPSVIAREQNASPGIIKAVKCKIADLLPFRSFSALFYGDFEYPTTLRDAKNPIEVLYYQGNLDLLSSKAVSVVGSRKPTDEGRRRARKIARLLVASDFTVMSGLATGIDTEAHRAAIEAGGRTISVIGTALNEVYPKENAELQRKISKEFLLVTQVPFYQYSMQDYRRNRGFFPERNKTMSALSQATIIVEASETSGTLIQARAALQQGRKLFILKSCFDRGLEWPERFLKRGAIKIEDGSEVLEQLR